VIVQDTPTRIRLYDLPEKQLREQLTYVDKSVDFELKKLRNNRWLREKNENAWREAMDELKKKRLQCILFEDEKGLWTYSGLGWWLAGKFQVPFKSEVVFPEPQTIPWAVVPDKIPRPHQVKMKELLLEAQQGGVEAATGSGKSLALMFIAKELGLKSVVMTPSVSIADQLHKEFERHLGKKYVGKFFGGKKDSAKKFVIAVDDSLTKVTKDSEHWENLAKAQVFIADESHLCPAKSLSRVCFGLLKDAPYRFFFSGTQVRNDGLDLLLDAITNKIVFRSTVIDGVNDGYLAKPMFRMVPVTSDSTYMRDDANEMTRRHLFHNPVLNQKAADIANLMVEQLDRPTVILIREVEQFALLLPHIRHKVAFAHGGLTKDNRGNIPQEYWESDPNDLVERFNAGEFPILVGTSCIVTGTDIRNVKTILFLRGGKSEIDIKQSVGRGTRKPAGKEDCFFVDFDVTNVDVCHRHAEVRKQTYQSIYPDFEEVDL
jgi:superfamily II DNA or RNA helicase